VTILHIDFETYSACELKDRGLHNYATDPTTGVHCMAFAFDDEAISCVDADEMNVGTLWRIDEHVKAGGLVYAHNAAFELAIWNGVCVPRYGWPELKPEQVRCTMAMAYAMSLPGALANAAPALGIEQRKDQAGARVMMQLAKPKSFEDGWTGEQCPACGGYGERYSKEYDHDASCPDCGGTGDRYGKKAIFWTPADDPAKFEELYAYCRQDVEVERALHHRLMELSDYEQKIWRLDYKINQRGIQVDLESIDKAIALVEAEKKRLNAEMLRVTGGVVGSCTEVQLLVKWIRTQGVEIKGLAKADVLDALSGELPPAVEAALRLRKEAAKSSTAKLIAMKERASADGRVRGIHQYHGAATGRWAGRGIQAQNFPRPRPGMKPEHIDDVIANLHQRDYIDMMYGPTMDAMADTLRGMLTAPRGKELTAIDFSAIEARVLAWLAGEEKVLDIFRTHGKIYEHAAAGIYHVPMDRVTKDQRQIGKVAVLALGYGGGVGAFQSMARVYGVKVPDDEADDIKKAWREAHPNIVHYWYDLERAAIAAIRQGGKHSAGACGRQCTFVKNGSFLWCQLPSKRVLCYPYPKIAERETPWGEMKEAVHFMAVNGTTNKWEETSTYGGSLSENVTQAVARDLLADALLRLDAAGYDIVMHIHDEAVMEIETTCDNDTLERVEKLMSETPAWAAGLPVSAEGWRAKRYRK